MIAIDDMNLPTLPVLNNTSFFFRCVCKRTTGAELHQLSPSKRNKVKRCFGYSSLMTFGSTGAIGLPGGASGSATAWPVNP